MEPLALLLVAGIMLASIIPVSLVLRTRPDLAPRVRRRLVALRIFLLPAGVALAFTPSFTPFVFDYQMALILLTAAGGLVFLYYTGQTGEKAIMYKRWGKWAFGLGLAVILLLAFVPTGAPTGAAAVGGAAPAATWRVDVSVATCGDITSDFTPVGACATAGSGIIVVNLAGSQSIGVRPSWQHFGAGSTASTGQVNGAARWSVSIKIARTDAGVVQAGVKVPYSINALWAPTGPWALASTNLTSVATVAFNSQLVNAIWWKDASANVFEGQPAQGSVCSIAPQSSCTIAFTMYFNEAQVKQVNPITGATSQYFNLAGNIILSSPDGGGSLPTIPVSVSIASCIGTAVGGLCT